MRRALMATLAICAVALASPAIGQVTLTTTNGTPLPYQIFGIGGTGNPVYGSSPNNTTVANVTYDGNTLMDMTNGFAQISDANPKSPSLFEVIINPDLLFTDMKFAVQLTGAGTVNVFYLLNGVAGDPNSFSSYTATCGTCSFSSGSMDNTNYLISGGTFNGIMIQSTTPIDLFEVKQNSYNPAVPEPATWGMMLLGFAGIGMALRHQRRRKGLMQVA